MYNTLHEQRENLILELKQLHLRNELSQTVGDNYFEPGMMEYLEQSDGSYNPQTGEILIRFEVKGTRYDGRTEQIEKVKASDPVRIIRDRENAYNSNNFTVLTARGKDLGNMPAELCNAIAPLYDSGNLVFEYSRTSFVEPISKRSRHAKQAVLFVELKMVLDV